MARAPCVWRRPVPSPAPDSSSSLSPRQPILATRRWWASIHSRPWSSADSKRPHNPARAVSSVVFLRFRLDLLLWNLPSFPLPYLLPNPFSLSWFEFFFFKIKNKKQVPATARVKHFSWITSGQIEASVVKCGFISVASDWLLPFCYFRHWTWLKSSSLVWPSGQSWNKVKKKEKSHDIRNLRHLILSEFPAPSTCWNVINFYNFYLKVVF